MKTLYLVLCMAALQSAFAQQQAIVSETTQAIKTYPFSDPDPVADPSRLFYPYFRFDGFSVLGKEKDWKVVELENEYIKVSLFPEIGGKVWGAVDKTTGKEFIYHNHVVKFRDIAMRGPWTSGGIEFNFGIIGHVPSTSTPVDYITKKKADGSVSCYISSYEWVTKTWWTVEVNLPKDKGYFTTNTTWHNSSSIDQPYYQWMNAGYRAAGNAQFCYPGTHSIGHGGESSPFPVDAEGRDLSWYEKNNFGNSKSYHIAGKYNDFYGVYWHNDQFGSIHHANYDDKLGMKIFLWGLSREGGIWEDLLTDQDGQYIELQSGRMYNQPASNSSYTPYKQTAFSPQGTDTWTEYWFPVKETRGVVKSSPIGALNVLREDGFLKLYLSPLQKLSTTVKLYKGDQLIHSLPLEADVLKTWKDSIRLDDSLTPGILRIEVGDDLLNYSEIASDNLLKRPVELPSDFDWNTVYGLSTQGEQWMNQKVYDKAEHYLKAALEKDRYYVPALNNLASLYYRQGRYEEALSLCRTALSINTYQGETNYLYGLCNYALGNETDAKDGFSIAAYSPSVRSAANVKLAELYVRDADWKKAEHYALRALEYNALNLSADQILLVIYRKSNQPEKAKALLAGVLDRVPLYHAARFEQYKLGASSKADFSALIRNELPFEVYEELADWYEAIGCTDEAIDLLSLAADYPVANYRRAYLLDRKGDAPAALAALEQANAQSPELVYPSRPSLLKALEWAKTKRPDWKIGYYEALVYWANQNKEKALSLMNACENADYAPFYLSRAALKTGADKLADLQKAEQTAQSWRTGFALMNYYTAAQDWKKAVETGNKYMKRYPGNYYIGLKFANALCESGQYPACILLLSSLQVLPNEGAYAGRAVYRAANLYQAMDQLSRKNYKAALRQIENSKSWPENLGVGKPYDSMIDNRLENFLEAKVCHGQGNRTKALELYKQVASFPTASRHFRAANLLSALALRESGDAQEADRLVASWNKEQPGNRVAEWCTAIYNGNTERAKALLDARTSQADATPWETTSRDADLDLIVRLF